MPALKLQIRRVSPNGNVGRAMLAGYRQLGDPKYLNVALRLAGFNMHEPISHNANYNAFCLFFEPELTQITGDMKYVQDAIHKYQYGVGPGQLLNGEWTAHNRHTCYMGIIGLGMAELAKVLPQDSELKLELRQRLIRLCNCFIGRFDENSGISHPHPTDGKVDGDGSSYALQAIMSTEEAYQLGLDTFIDQVVAWLLEHRDKQLADIHNWNTIYTEIAILGRYIATRYK